MRIHFAMPFLIFVLLSSESTSDAIVFCGRKDHATGSVRDGASIKLRDSACRGSEVQLDPEALGLQGRPGPQGAAGPPGPDGVQGPEGANGKPGVAIVRDANGLLVGQVVELGRVLVAVEDQQVILNLGPSDIPRSGQVYYESVDCNGDAFVPTTETLPLQAAVQAGVLYAPLAAASSVQLSVRSVRDTGGPACEPISPMLRTLLPTVQQYITVYQPPFVVVVE